MNEFDLIAMAREAGLKAAKILSAIETTDALETELYSIIWQMISAYRQSIGMIEDRWEIDQLTKETVSAILADATVAGTAVAVNIEPAVDNWARRVERWHRTRWAGVVKSSLRLDIEPILAQGDVRRLVEAATQRNVGLITGLANEIEKKIYTRVWTAYADGTNARQLAKELRADIGFAPKRAKLIARDQLGKFSGALDKARHQQAGLDEYIWRTVGDDHVRPRHRANNGKRFSWGKRPASTGHPGEDINCRCKASAVIYTAEEEAELEELIKSL